MLHLQLELRHDNKFKTIFTIDESLLRDDYRVPPLIIQPFVENAILHGLINKEGNAGILKIEIKKSGSQIQYEISDNGIGRKAAANISSSKNKSYGLQMSYDRIKLFNKEDKASVTIYDLAGHNGAAGTQISVKLNPL